MLLVGRRLLPQRGEGAETERRQDKDYHTEVIVRAGSPLAGQTLGEANFREAYELQIIGIERRGEQLLPHRDAVLEAGDVLLVRGKLNKILSVKEAQGLDLKSDTTAANSDQSSAQASAVARAEVHAAERAPVERRVG